ncbi:MAG: CHAT domain-containing protein [Bacteroidota bacterium]
MDLVRIYILIFLLLVELIGTKGLYAQTIDTSAFETWREQVAYFNECKDYDSVLVYAEKVRRLAIENHLDELQLEFTCEQVLAHYRVYTRSSDKLFRLLQEALPVANRMLERGDSSVWVVKSFESLSGLYSFLLKDTLEKTYLDKALAAIPSEKEGFSKVKSEVLTKLGIYHISSPDLDSATYYLDVARLLMAPESIELFHWYGSKAHLEFQRENFAAAERYYLGQMSLVEQLNQYEYRDLVLYHKLAHTNIKFGDYDKALGYIGQARNGVRKDLLLSYVYLKDEDFGNALHHLTYAKQKIHTEKGYLLNYLSSTYSLLGGAYFKMEILDSAKTYFQKTFDVKKNKTFVDSLSLHYHFGKIYLLQGNYSQALTHFDYVKLCERSPGGNVNKMDSYIWYELHKTYLKLAHPQKALSSLTKAAQILLSREIALSDLGEMSIKNIIEPHIYFSYISDFANVYISLFEQQKHQPYLDSAMFFIDKADHLLDTLQIQFQGELAKKELGQNASLLYMRAVNVSKLFYQQTGEERYLQRAFYFVEKSKSFRLFESIRESEARQFLNVPDSLLLEEQTLLSDIQYQERQLQAFRDKAKENVQKGTGKHLGSRRETSSRILFKKKQKYQQLLRHFETEYPDYFLQKYDRRTKSLKEVQRECINTQSAMLEYLVEDSIVYVFVITPDTALLQQLTIQMDLDSSIQALRESLYAYWLSDSRSASSYSTTVHSYTSLAHQLYQEIMAPILPFLERVETLTIIPDGTLAYLPFEVLLTKQVEMPHHFASHPYLIRRYSITYGFSATTLFRDHIPKRGRRNCLAIRPSFDQSEQTFASIRSRRRDGFGPLRFSKEETHFLAHAFEADLLEDSMATKEQVIHALNSGQYAVIHLATHAKSHDVYPKKAKIALTAILDSTEDNDFLSFSEIFNLRLQTEMVVLSACETGLGEFQKGEGVMSLARAFAYAGARSVVTTLWSVDDKSTAQLMKDFYTQLEVGESKGKALQQAKLAYLKVNDHRFAHPFFWAGPVVIGDGGAVLLGKTSVWRIWLLLALGFVLCGFLIFGSRSRRLSR